MLSEDDGPVTLLPADCPGLEQLSIFPIHKTDAVMAKIDAEKKAVRIFGRRGTIFLIDTFRCFHRGSRMGPENRRRAVICTYVSHLANLTFYPKINGSGEWLFRGNPGVLFGRR